MKQTPHRRSGKGTLGIVIIVGVTLVLGISLYLWHHHNKSGALRVSGTITSDTCAPDYHQIPDVGCSIVVGGYSVEVEAGFSGVPFRGSVTGLDGSSLKGRQATVYAQKDGPSNTLDVSSSSKYYVHIH